MQSVIRSRWAAIGAAVAVALGGGGIGLVSATSPSSAVTFVPITPCRVMDTRPTPDTVGPRSAPLGAAETHTVAVHGNNGSCADIPISATAVALNVTAVGASTLTFLTIWETGKAQPDASSLNPAPGQPPTPNAVTTGINPSGQFNIFNKFGTVNVLADITGYYVDHNHDDRYYTQAQSDAAIDARVPPTQQLNVWFDAFTSERSSDELLRSGTNTSDGVSFLSGAAGGSGVMGAPVQLPDGATITSMVAYLLDNSTTVSNRLEVTFSCHHVPTGPVTANAIESNDRLRITSTAGGNTAPGTFAPFTLTPFAGAADPVVIDTDDCAYGLEIRTSPSTWNTEPNGSFRVLGVTIDYTMPG